MATQNQTINDQKPKERPGIHANRKQKQAACRDTQKEHIDPTQNR